MTLRALLSIVIALASAAAGCDAILDLEPAASTTSSDGGCGAPAPQVDAASACDVSSSCDCCRACVDADPTLCKSLSDACDGEPTCKIFIDCVYGCVDADPNCIESCIEGNEMGWLAGASFVCCIDDACSTCKVENVCKAGSN